MSDEQLLALIAEGDGQALTELYSRYARKVYAIARRLLVDQNACEEVVQDVFTRVWTTRSFNPNEGLVEHWICVIARRVAIEFDSIQITLEPNWGNSQPEGPVVLEATAQHE